MLFPSGINTDFASNNPENNNSLKTDPAVPKDISCNYGLMVINETNKVADIMKKIHTKITIYAGEDDKICSSLVTEKMCKNFPSEIFQFNLVKGAGHEIFNEKSEIQKSTLLALQNWAESLYQEH